MQKTTMTTKGQVTVPKPVRDALGLRPGSKVLFEYSGGGRATIRAAGKTARSKFAAVRGSLKDELSTDQIMTLLRGD
jgi:AbrB family looped-hinge helix DNA binding protein